MSPDRFPEIPDEALEAFADEMIEQIDYDPPRDVLRECFAAALPTLRRQWGEEMVEAVARAMHGLLLSYGTHPHPTADELIAAWGAAPEEARAHLADIAAGVLGLDGEETT